jgi:4-hydroxy-tetrahydrodipicolinate reductase
MDPLSVVILGASGRMGRMLIRAVMEEPACALIGALEREGSVHLGEDSGSLAGIAANGVPLTADLLPLLVKAQALIDFSSPAATINASILAAQARIPHVIGTTGLSREDHDALNRAAWHAPIIQSGNMSLGVTMLTSLVRQAAAALGHGYDIEICEMHHRHKVDAPSGTALLLGEAAAEGREVALDSVSIRSRDGHTGARPEGSIGFATLRGGSVVGDHSVILAGPGERITLSHHAEDRMIFARGAVKAALWGAKQKPGRYTMTDVLGIKG